MRGTTSESLILEKVWQCTNISPLWVHTRMLWPLMFWWSGWMKWKIKQTPTHQHQQHQQNSRGGRIHCFQARAHLQMKVVPPQTRSSSGRCRWPSAERWWRSESGCSGLHWCWFDSCQHRRACWTPSWCTWREPLCAAARCASGTCREEPGSSDPPRRAEPRSRPHSAPRTECHCRLQSNRETGVSE